MAPTTFHGSFLALASANPDRVEQAVSKNDSSRHTLKALGYPNEASRREQLQDAVLYYGWATDHWDSPVPTGLTALRDFSDPSQGETYGAAFETRVTDRILEVLGEREGGKEVYHCGQYSYYTEAGVRALDLVPMRTPPWDGVLLDHARRRLWAFEVKVGMKHMSKARKQVEAREPWLDALRKDGWVTRAVCVVSMLASTNRHRGAESIRKTGAWAGSLPELDLTELLAAGSVDD